MTLKREDASGAELLVAGEQAEIGINFRGGVVVVAGAEVQVAADAVFLAADNERDFAVGLEAGQTVNDVAAGFFKLLCPVDVVFFVKARFQLDKHRDLFAVFGGFDERRDDGRVAADAVESLLDGEYVSSSAACAMNCTTQSNVSYGW